MFVDSVYRNRRSLLKHAIDSGGLIWLQGNGMIGMNYRANAYDFVQDSNFLYYTGIESPDVHLVIDIDADKTILYGTPYTSSDLVWIGEKTSLDKWAQYAAIDEVRGLDELEKKLKSTSSSSRPIHTLPSYRAEQAAKCLQFAGKYLAPSMELIQGIIAQRSEKEDREIMEMENALSITAELHETAMKMANEGTSEAEILGKMYEIAYSHHSRFAYSPIITTDGQVLHKTSYENTLRKDQFLLCDMGVANIMGYASDITRTTPTNRTFNTQQKLIYQIVLDAQEHAISQCAPGVVFQDIHKSTCAILVEGLKSIGILHGATDDIIDQGAHALFFPHGLGHMIGLDVHDMEGLGEDLVGYDDHTERSEQFGLAYLRLGKELKRSNVVTVEPGLYFIPNLIASWQAEKKHASYIDYAKANEYLGLGGVRIEDNVLITSDGHRVLGPPIPKYIEQIEDL